MSSPRVVPTSDHLAARYPFLGYLREYRRAKWKVLLAAFIAMVKHSPVILIPIYTGYILDHMVPRRDVGGVLLCALGMVGLVIMNIGLHPLYVRLFSRARREVSLRLRAKLCRRIQQLVFAYHDSSRPGQLHSKVMQDVEKLDRLVPVRLATDDEFVVVVAGDAGGEDERREESLASRFDGDGRAPEAGAVEIAKTRVGEVRAGAMRAKERHENHAMPLLASPPFSAWT